MKPEFFLKAIRFIAYAIVAFIPLAYWKFTMYPFQITRTVLFQILVEVMFAFWIGLAAYHAEYRPRSTPILWAFFALILAMTISGIFGIDPRQSFWSNEARTFGVVAVYHVFAFFLVLASLRREIRWERMFALSMLTSGVIAVVAVIQRFFFPYLVAATDTLRPGSLFGNPTFLAGYLLFHVFIGLWLLFRANGGEFSRKAWRYLALGVVFLNLFAIFLAQTIGVILGLAAGLGVLLLFFAFKDERPNVRKIAIAVLGAGILFAAGFWATRHAAFWETIPGLRRVSTISFESNQVQFRLIGWKNALLGFGERPILGWGWENFNVPFNARYDPRLLTTNFSETFWDKPHNTFLEHLVTGGIVGFLAYLSLVGAVFYGIWRGRFPISEPLPQEEGPAAGPQAASITPFLFAAFIAYYLQNLVVFDTIGTYLMFGLLAAFISSRYPVREAVHAPAQPRSPKFVPVAIAIPFVLALIPVYYNTQIFQASHKEWEGVNYFLNNFLEASALSFNAALETNTPYLDDIRKNYAGTVKQAYGQGLVYPDISALQKRLAGELEKVIARHPRDYFNYLVLADFKNVFSVIEPEHLKDTHALAARALELSPRRQQAYYVLARTKILEGDHQAALELFSEAIALNPQASEPHFYYALLAYQVALDALRGQDAAQVAAMTAKADEELARATELGRLPQEMQEAIVLGNFMGDLKQDYAAAADYFRSAIVLGKYKGSDTRDAQLKLAVSYYFNHDPDAARVTFEALAKELNLRELRIYEDLEPILRQLGAQY
ncbi:MAG: hypothetical protein UY96_C0026G0002 [Parcubacteria group bacterium GW2011_GWB1_56_8]|nr:MAG: hypothetical protein UY96_C0026G0002 [Parcubacteria group bacterium GW2011_GWB1_56_8]